MMYIIILINYRDPVVLPSTWNRGMQTFSNFLMPRKIMVNLNANTLLLKLMNKYGLKKNHLKLLLNNFCLNFYKATDKTFFSF